MSTGILGVLRRAEDLGNTCKIAAILQIFLAQVCFCMIMPLKTYEKAFIDEFKCCNGIVFTFNKSFVLNPFFESAYFCKQWTEFENWVEKKKFADIFNCILCMDVYGNNGCWSGPYTNCAQFDDYCCIEEGTSCFRRFGCCYSRSCRMPFHHL